MIAPFPTLNTDWWNYGGITRDVKIIETPESLIANYNLQVSKENPSIIKGNIKLNGKELGDKKVFLEIPELKVKKSYRPSNKGVAEFEFSVKDIEMWSPESPKLYQVKLQYENDVIIDSIGFRTIETIGSDILLNNKSIFLKGISIHEESPIHPGRANHSLDS